MENKPSCGNRALRWDVDTGETHKRNYWSLLVEEMLILSRGIWVFRVNCGAKKYRLRDYWHFPADKSYWQSLRVQNKGILYLLVNVWKYSRLIHKDCSRIPLASRNPWNLEVNKQAVTLGQNPIGVSDPYKHSCKVRPRNAEKIPGPLGPYVAGKHKGDLNRKQRYLTHIGAFARSNRGKRWKLFLKPQQLIFIH